MTRQRDLTSSEWFHVVQKGADEQDIFSAASHRSVYEDLLDDAFRRSRIELHAYTWMTNHTHQLVHAPHGGVAEAMHRIGTRYASLYNGWTDRTGPLFTRGTTACRSLRTLSWPRRRDTYIAIRSRSSERSDSATTGGRVWARCVVGDGPPTGWPSVW